MNQIRLKYLFEKYLNNQMNRSELEEFLNLINGCDDEAFDKIIQESKKIKDQSLNDVPFEKVKVFDFLTNRIKDTEEPIPFIKGKLIISKWVWTAVASILLVSVWFYTTQDDRSVKNSNRLTNKNDINLPMIDQATILRSDGKSYHISEDSSNGLPEEGLVITKDSAGNVYYKLYQATAALSESRTFICPKGSSLQLELVDGTNIWLNSGASVTYPAVFSKDKREIAIKGEVFLDVFPNKNQPFIVHAENTKIKVLGTEFNIATNRSNTTVTTTLVEGKVEVFSGNQSEVLKPGFKSISDNQKNQIKIEEADLQQVLAWKEGYFRFDNDQIETVMIKIQEWYDIEKVSYLRKSEDSYSGMIKRTKSLKELLKQMEQISSYKFLIRDGEVLVM